MRPRAAELLAATATAAVTGWGLTGPGPWRDELATRLAAGRDLADLWTLTRTVDLVHLPYYVLAHGVLALHDSITALRLLSVAATAATAAVLVATGRRLGSVRTGLTAGLLLAVAPLASRYGQEARPYATAALAAAVAAWRLVVATEASDTSGTPGARRAWAWYAAAVATTGLTNVLALLVLAGHAVFVAVLRRRSAGAWCAATAAAVVVLAPFLVATSRQSGQVGWLARPGPADLVAVLSAPFDAWLLPALLLAVAVALRGNRPALVLGAAWGLLPPVLLWLVSQAHPLFDGRYVVAALPGAALALASLASLADRSPPPARAAPGGRWRTLLAPALVPALVPALAASGWTAQRHYRDASGHGEDVRGAVRLVAAGARPGDAVLFVPYHLRILLLPGPDARPPAPGDPPPDDVALERGPVASATLTGLDVRPEDLPGRLAGRERVWLVTGSDGPPPATTPTDRAKLDLLAREYTEVSRQRVERFAVVLLHRR